jgi:hypothetical protein
MKNQQSITRKKALKFMALGSASTLFLPAVLQLPATQME